MAEFQEVGKAGNVKIAKDAVSVQLRGHFAKAYHPGMAQ